MGSEGTARLERDLAEARAVAEEAVNRYNALLAETADVCCAFCGERYPKGTPRSGDGALAEHIKVCAKHPMREAEAKIADLTARLDTERELKECAEENLRTLVKMAETRNRNLPVGGPAITVRDALFALFARVSTLEDELQEAKDCQKTGDDACGACLRCLTIRCGDLVEERARALEQVKGYQTECREVEQILGAALGYPWFKDDPANFPGATEKDGVCVGEHVPSTIAAEAAKTIEKLKADLTRAEGRIGEDWRDRLLDS